MLQQRHTQPTRTRTSARAQETLRWTEIVARIGVSSLLLPALLISSLLSFPATCQCGAELPHTHALFSLSGHSHTGADVAALAGDPGHPHADAHEHGPEAVVTSVEPVTALAPASLIAPTAFVPSASDRETTDEVAQMQPPGSVPAAPAVGLLLDAVISLVPGPAAATLVVDAPALAGLATSPDSPPPQG